MTCGKGGYVRSHRPRPRRARSAASATSPTLRRLWSGPFTLEGAVDWATLEAEARAPAPRGPAAAGRRRRSPACPSSPARRTPRSGSSTATPVPLPRRRPRRGRAGLGEPRRRAARASASGAAARCTPRASSCSADGRLRSAARRASRHIEPRALVALLLVAACVWAFVGLADEVVEGETHGFDTRLLLALRNPGRSRRPARPRLGRGARPRRHRARRHRHPRPRSRSRSRAFSGCRATAARCGWCCSRSPAARLLSSLAKPASTGRAPTWCRTGCMVYTASFPSGHSMMAAVTYLTLAALVARVQPTRALKVYVLTLAVARHRRGRRQPGLSRRPLADRRARRLDRRRRLGARLLARRLLAREPRRRRARALTAQSGIAKPAPDASVRLGRGPRRPAPSRPGRARAAADSRSSRRGSRSAPAAARRRSPRRERPRRPPPAASRPATPRRPQPVR